MTYIRELPPADYAAAFEIMRQLRDQLDLAEFERRVRRQHEQGYRLYGAFDDGRVRGVMGMRPVCTLARGEHFHIDDLVTDTAARGAGIGKAMLDHAMQLARAQSKAAIFLDSRAEVVEFYAALGFKPHTATLMVWRA
jgi:GNAT superfamily N-acetyltransferase